MSSRVCWRPSWVIEEMIKLADGFVALLMRLKTPGVLEGSITRSGTRNVWLLVTGGFIRMLLLLAHVQNSGFGHADGNHDRRIR